MSNSLKTLISKLNDTCRQAAERAAGLCMARGNYEVDLEHLLLALLEENGCDLHCILRRCAISPTGVERELHAEIDRFKTGNGRTPVFSAHLPKLFEQAWLIASLDARLPRIRSGHLLLALLTAPDLAQLAQSTGTSQRRLSEAFKKCVGVTIFEFLREERMKEARHLLANTSLDIQSIALEVGFTSGANFATAFRERFGISPSAFRRDRPVQD